MSSRYFVQNDMQLNQLKHKDLSPQIHFATLIYDKQIKSVHILVEHGTVLPSQKDNCHSILADFRIDQFSISNIYEEENIIIKPLD